MPKCFVSLGPSLVSGADSTRELFSSNMKKVYFSPTLHLHSGGTNPLWFFKSPSSATIRLGLSRHPSFWGWSFSNTKEGAARFWVPKPRTWRWDPNYLLWWLPMLPTAFVHMRSGWGQQRSSMCTEWMADLLCDPEVTAGPLWSLRDSLLSASQSCSGDQWFSWKRSVNHKMPFCMFIITLAYFGCTKNFFTKKRWTSLENELSMLKNNAEGIPFGGPVFQIHSPHLVTPGCATHTKQPCKFIHYKPSRLKGFSWSWSKGVGREKKGLILVRMSLTSCNFKVTWNKFKCLFLPCKHLFGEKGSSKLSLPCKFNISINSMKKTSNMDQTMNDQLTRMLWVC